MSHLAGAVPLSSSCDDGEEYDAMRCCLSFEGPKSTILSACLFEYFFWVTPRLENVFPGKYDHFLILQSQ